jgi:hypothetical protein
MRNLILGGVLAIWGTAVLIIDLAGGQSNHGGAYGDGQSAGLVFAAILVVAGISAVRKGLRERRG